MQIKPLVSNFISPTYGTAGSAAFDIYLQEDTELKIGINNKIHLGFATAIPEGFVGLLLPRSGIGCKGIGLRNTVGVIDSDYRGEWIANITIDEQDTNSKDQILKYSRGDRLLQCLIVPIKQVQLEIVDELQATQRGAGGFGSTGK
jgi:dUTP pyrophosphatase